MIWFFVQNRGSIVWRVLLALCYRAFSHRVIPELTILACCVDGVACAESPALRVMTYNVRYASDQGPHRWQLRRPIARQMLAEQRPDVIGMQEAFYRQVKDFEQDLPAHGWIGLGREGGSRSEFMAVFFRRDRLEPLEFNHYWLSDTPHVVGSATWGHSNRRMVTWVRFRDRASKQQFYFVNTHFDHEVRIAREKSARLVLQRMAKWNTEVPVLLVGDFNAAAEKSRVYSLLVGSDRLTDTWLAAATRGELFATFHGYRGPRRSGARIDWILSRGAVRARSSEIITFQQQGRFPSDHFPVVADVQIGP